jgi:hypothetical protein
MKPDRGVPYDVGRSATVHSWDSPQGGGATRLTHMKKYLILGLPAIAAPAFVHAIEAGPVDVHGSVSVTASYTDKYNFYGDTEGSLEVNVVEAIINGTHRFSNGLRAGAQLYAYKLGDTKDVTLDWANLDYSFRPEIGVRVGRNKLPMGLYNDSQDLDMIRIFASLPLGFYPRYLRPITSAFDGVSVYGVLPLGKAGSFDYQIFGGYGEDVEDDTFFLKNFSGWTHYNVWELDKIYGAQVFWNTPADGLKFGIGVVRYVNSNLRGVADYSAHLSGTDLAFVSRFGPGVWDKAFAGSPVESRNMTIQFSTASAEYTRGKWTFAAEYKKIDIDGYTFAPKLGMMSAGREAIQRLLFYYVSASYQWTDKLGVAAYYSFRDDNYEKRRSVNNWQEVGKDYCVAGSYALTEQFLLKLEYHWNDGTPLIGDTTRGVSYNQRHWDNIVAKVTFSF